MAAADRRTPTFTWRLYARDRALQVDPPRMPAAGMAPDLLVQRLVGPHRVDLQVAARVVVDDRAACHRTGRGRRRHDEAGYPEEADLRGLIGRPASNSYVLSGEQLRGGGIDRPVLAVL